jgi:hypothetical protein
MFCVPCILFIHPYNCQPLHWLAVIWMYQASILYTSGVFELSLRKMTRCRAKSEEYRGGYGYQPNSG